jgi:hypothetical protein
MNYSPIGFRPANNLALVVVIGLGLMGLFEALTFLAGIGEIADPSQVVMFGGEANSPWLLAQGLIALFQVPVYIATLVMFLIWLFRIYKNLDFLESQQHREFTPGWAVGWWFVPFANLVKPFQVMREAWFDSNPEIETEQTFLSASLRAAPSYMGFWWALWIGSNIFSNIAGRFSDLNDPADVPLLGLVFILASGLSIAAAIICIKMVRDITSRQEQRFANLQIKHSYDPPPPPTFVSSTF